MASPGIAPISVELEGFSGTGRVATPALLTAMLRAAEKISDLLASLIDGIVGGFAVEMGARRVAEVRLEVREHGLQNGGVNRRGGVVVEVDHARASGAK